MSVRVYCQNCGAEHIIDDNRESVFCSNCGASVTNTAFNGYEAQNAYAANEGANSISEYNSPNLYISFATVNNDVKMVVKVVDSGQKNYYLNNQTLSYQLAPGMHQLIFIIGSKSYSRTIYVSNAGEPVKVYASWNGRAMINIDQPSNTANMSQYAMNANYQQNLTLQNHNPQSVLGIIGFICAMSFYGSIAGLILGIIDLSINENNKRHGLAKAGLIISAIEIVLFIISLL